MRDDNGLSNRARLTQTSYQRAVSETVAGLQDGDTDQDMAQAWGVSKGTVLNARNRNHDLSAIPLLKIGERFGLGALDTVMSLIGGRVVGRDEVTVDVSAIPCDVARTLPLLIDLFKDGDCSTADVRTLEQAGAIDCFAKLADMLRNKRDAMRLDAVA